MAESLKIELGNSELMEVAPSEGKEPEPDGESMRLSPAQKTLFIPHLPQDPGYMLMYAPYSILMFIKFHFSIYERVFKAKQLVGEKLT